MKLRKFLRSDKIGLSVFLAVMLLAAAGAAYLVVAAGANVNCVATACSSTNGQQNTPGGDSTNVFTGENDTASIEAAGGTYSGGGGNDTFYIRDPQTAGKAVVTVEGEGGDDVILDGSTVDNNVLSGNDGNDFIANDAAGTLYGDDGNDLLAGGRGDDTLEGGNDNDVLVGGPGNDEFTSAAGDGDDTVIDHRGDVPTGQVEGQYICQDDDLILLFGFNIDLVHVMGPNTPNQIFGFAAGQVPAECDIATPGTSNACFADPVNNSTGQADGARYHFEAQAGSTCTIISVD